MSMVSTIAERLTPLTAASIDQLLDGQGIPTLKGIIALAFGFVNVFLFAVAPAVLVVMIINAGVKRIMAADNSKAVQDSTSTLTWAVIGYGVVLAAYFGIRLVLSLLGLDIGGGVFI